MPVNSHAATVVSYKIPVSISLQMALRFCINHHVQRRNKSSCFLQRIQRGFGKDFIGWWMAGDGLDIPNTLTGCLPSSGHFDVPIPKHSPFIRKNLPSCKQAWCQKTSYTTSASEGMRQDRAKGFSFISYNSSCLSPATCFCTAPHRSFIPASLASPANRLTKKKRA